MLGTRMYHVRSFLNPGLRPEGGLCKLSLQSFFHARLEMTATTYCYYVLLLRATLIRHTIFLWPQGAKQRRLGCLLSGRRLYSQEPLRCHHHKGPFPLHLAMNAVDGSQHYEQASTGELTGGRNYAG